MNIHRMRALSDSVITEYDDSTTIRIIFITDYAATHTHKLL